MVLHPDRFLPSDPAVRGIARRLLGEVESLPIVSPHGHTNPRWFADDAPFESAVATFLWPDHYLLRMLYSQGISLGRLGIADRDGGPVERDHRKIWRLFGEQYYLFRGAPSHQWLDHVFGEVFGIPGRLSAATADEFFDAIADSLKRAEFRPRALFKRFNIEILATTESALDPLVHHAKIAREWDGRVITTFRPDDVVDPEFSGFADNIDKLGVLTGEDVSEWKGYLAAIRARREVFRAHGAVATDHGHPTAATADISLADAEVLYAKVRRGAATPAEAELFRAQMLTELAQMSLDDGMVMQIHPGSFRNHNPALYAKYDRDRGADIPVRTEYTRALHPMLSRLGNEPGLTIILFTLDESNYARELAPLAGHYPCLRLGPPWWFHDSPEGIRRFREQTTETAGFYNCAGFNDDTRAFFSIPARHDLARRSDCAYLAELVATHRLEEDEAAELAVDLAYRLAKAAYRL
jgi:glucuronate isomerase